MSETDVVQYSAIGGDPESAAPRLPIESHLVRAVRALEALKVKADDLLFLLEHLPGDTDQGNRAVFEIVRLTNAASAAHHSFTEVRSCRGQG